jgi:hypothetical protein
MAKRALMFKQRDVTRALKAAERAGIKVAGYTITKQGDISIRTAEMGNTDVEDKELAEFRKTNGYT